MSKNLNKKLNIKFLLKYVIIFILLFILSKAYVCKTSPFTISLLFCLMWTGFNIFIISSEYIIVSLINDMSLMTLYCLITTIGVMILFYVVHKKLKKPMNLSLVCLYAVISQITFLYYAIANGLEIINIVIYFSLLLISLVFYVLIFQLSILRGFYYKTTLNESLSLFYFVVSLGIGLSNIVWFDFSFIKLVSVFAILFLCLIKKNTEAIYCALAFGIGESINSFNFEFLALISILVLSANIFKYPQRYKMFFCILVVDIFCQMYFYKISLTLIYNIVPTVVGGVLALCFNKKTIEKLQDKFYICESEMSMRNIVNLTRKNMHRKFNELSNVFNEMRTIYLNLIKEDLSHEQVVNMLTNEIMKTMCKDCLDKQKCFKNVLGEKQSIISKLLDIAITKGKITLLDIPSNLAVRCAMVNLLIGRINQIVSQYSQFVGMKKDINNVKYLLAEQLGAVSQIMLDLGDEVDKNISFDSHLEMQIINELLENNIICSEVLLYKENEYEPQVNLIVKGENAYNPEIEKILSKKLKTQMKVSSVLPLDINGFYSVLLSKNNNYDIIFGLSSCTKTGSTISGDTHSLIRLPNNRLLMALCDGMGSGERANKTSALTISLIENFYKAGFNNDMVVASVNKLLAINNQENFATLDLCLVDLNKEMVDFIKVGAPESVVKHNNVTEKIIGGALPIGVLESVTPTYFRTSVDTQSIIVMATDGVVDAFSEEDEFKHFIQEIASTNPQTIAQTVLDEALRKNDNVIKDDMTVLVARTYLKNG